MSIKRATSVCLPIEPQISKTQTAREVKIAVIFSRLTEIDTINEKFSCEATLFASWIESLSSLNKGDSEVFYFDPETQWDPQLYIDNAIGEVKEKDVKYHLEKFYDEKKNEYFVEVNMIKRIQGIFFEKLELYHFPFDVQDLSITVTSHRPSNEVVLNIDDHNPSKVIKHASLDKHIWKLHQHVNVKLHTIINDFYEDPENPYNHAAITIQCRVARKPGYFVVNCLLPTLMITLCVFFTFLMDYSRFHYRFSLLFTTMLTSITFRWAIQGKSLPCVSYICFLDMYSVSSIFIVFLCMVWHAVYAVIYKEDEDLAVRSDFYAMCGFGVIVFVIHLVQLIWFFIALQKRLELDILDKKSEMDQLQFRAQNPVTKNKRRKLMSSLRHKANIIVTNNSSFKKVELKMDPYSPKREIEL